MVENPLIRSRAAATLAAVLSTFATTEAHDGRFAAQYKARDEMTPSERAARRHEQSLAHQSVRFFKSIGIGLTVVGFGFGGLLYPGCGCYLMP